MQVSRRKTPAVLLVVAALATTAADCSLPGLVIPEDGVLHALHFRGAPDVPVVALTFDDGPNGACTAAVLDALADVHAPATFFVLGANVAAGGNDEVLARMRREGHEIAIHGWHHEGPFLVRAASLRGDLRATAAALDSAFGGAGVPVPPPRFYRPPYGFLTAGTAKEAEAGGYAVVLWTVSVGDWKRGRNAAGIVDSIVAASGPGAVIVLHDGDRERQVSRVRCRDRAIVADVVRLLVPRLREKGLEVAPLAVVLGMEPAAAPSLSPPRR